VGRAQPVAAPAHGEGPVQRRAPAAAAHAARLRHPGPLHYVRNHSTVPRADWATWTVEVTGLVRRPARLAMADLAGGFRAGAPRHARLLQRPAQGAEHGAADAGLQLGPRRRVHLGGAARRSATCCAGAC